MAQEVGYFEDDITYKEGPFVMVNIGGWRIESEVKRHKCPALLHPSIYDMLQSAGLYKSKTGNKAEVAKAVDWLNQMVRDGKIILRGCTWQAVTEENRP